MYHFLRRFGTYSDKIQRCIQIINMIPVFDFFRIQIIHNIQNCVSEAKNIFEAKYERK